MDPALIDRGNLMYGDWANYSRYDSQSKFWCRITVQNSVTVNSSSLSPTGGVNSISPIQQNSMNNGYDENNGYGKER